MLCNILKRTDENGFIQNLNYGTLHTPSTRQYKTASYIVFVMLVQALPLISGNAMSFLE
jgi:hypothetical protein